MINAKRRLTYAPKKEANDQLIVAGSIQVDSTITRLLSLMYIMVQIRLAEIKFNREMLWVGVAPVELRPSETRAGLEPRSFQYKG